MDIKGLFVLVEERWSLTIEAEWGCDLVEGRGDLDMDIEGGDSVLEGIGMNT